MKTKFKKIFLGFLVCVFSFSAFPVFAETTVSGNPASFCQNIDSFVLKIHEETLEQLKKVKAYRIKKTSEFSTKESKEESLLLAERSREDAKNKDLLEKLRSKAETTEQKSALSVFETELGKLLEVRRQKVETALANYRLGKRRLLENYNANVIAITRSFDESIATGALKAKEACSSGISPEVARNDFKKVLQEASNGLRDDEKVLNKTLGRIQDLLSTQSAALKKADAEYKSGIQKATRELKEVFK